MVLGIAAVIGCHEMLLVLSIFPLNHDRLGVIGDVMVDLFQWKTICQADQGGYGDAVRDDQDPPGGVGLRDLIRHGCRAPGCLAVGLAARRGNVQHLGPAGEHHFWIAGVHKITGLAFPFSQAHFTQAGVFLDGQFQRFRQDLSRLVRAAEVAGVDG